MDNALHNKTAARKSAFKRLFSHQTSDVIVYVDGQAISMQPHDTAAAAVLASELRYGRTTPATGSARAPYCMMGICFECLLEIDGLQNVQGCMTQVKDGMQIQRQLQARQLAAASHSNPSARSEENPVQIYDAS